MAKKKASTAKKVLMGLAALSLTAGSLAIGKHVYDGMPHYKAGDCLLDTEANLYVAITGVEKDGYDIVIVLPFAQLQGKMPIRQMNAIKTLVKVSCQTGERLDGKTN